MAGLTVTEKEHWKSRIARRIDQRIEAICASEPALMDRISREARQRALESLGLADSQAELDRIDEQKEHLERREQQLHQLMLATVCRVPLEDVDRFNYGPHQEVVNAIQRRQTVHEDELLADDPLGKQILALRREKEDLLDTVWLATSSQQIKELWKKVTELLGEKETLLQGHALAIAPIQPE